jgi:hypothetical protein
MQHASETLPTCATFSDLLLQHPYDLTTTYL